MIRVIEENNSIKYKRMEGHFSTMSTIHRVTTNNKICSIKHILSTIFDTILRKKVAVFSLSMECEENSSKMVGFSHPIFFAFLLLSQFSCTCLLFFYCNKKKKLKAFAQ